MTKAQKGHFYHHLLSLSIVPGRIHRAIHRAHSLVKGSKISIKADIGTPVNDSEFFSIRSINKCKNTEWRHLQVHRNGVREGQYIYDQKRDNNIAKNESKRRRRRKSAKKKLKIIIINYY